MNMFTRISTLIAGSLAVLSMVGFYYEPTLFAWYEITLKLTENLTLSPGIYKVLIGGIGEVEGKLISLFTVSPAPEEDILIGGRLALGGSIVILMSSFINSGTLNWIGSVLFGFVVVNSYLTLMTQVDAQFIAQLGMGFFIAVGSLLINLLGLLTDND